jgi:hypothetical protein
MQIKVAKRNDQAWVEDVWYENDCVRGTLQQAVGSCVFNVSTWLQHSMFYKLRMPNRHNINDRIGNPPVQLFSKDHSDTLGKFKDD